MKTLIVSKDCSPSRLISCRDFSVTKVIISYGGGMGGTSQIYYCTDVLERVTDDPVSYTRLTEISGQQTEMNPRFIVSKTVVKLVEIKVDVTGHSYLDETGSRKAVRTILIELKHGQKYEYDDNRGGRNEQVILDEVTKS